MLFVKLVAQDGERRMVDSHKRRKVGVYPPRHYGALAAICGRQAGKSTVNKGRDVDSNSDSTDVVFIEFELRHECAWASLESSFILSSLNGVFNRDHFLADLSPFYLRSSGSTALAVR